MMERFYQILPKLYYASRKYLLEQARRLGLPHGQPRILDFLSRNDGCIQKRFCDEFSLEASSISGLLMIMEREGVLYRKRNVQSPRIVNVYITEQGKKVQQQLGAVYDKIEDITFQDFTPEEKQACLEYLDRMTKNMMAFRDSNGK